jgi:hypothetical protein
LEVAVLALLALMVAVLKVVMVVILLLVPLHQLVVAVEGHTLLVQAMLVVQAAVVQLIMVLVVLAILLLQPQCKDILAVMRHLHPGVFGQVTGAVVVAQVAPAAVEKLHQQLVYKAAVVMGCNG